MCRISVDGKDVIVRKDTTKNKTSLRTLPLIPDVEKLLLKTKKQQESNRRKCRNAYNKKFLDYVCVDSLGVLLKPDYLTQHFEIIIKKKQLKVYSVSRFATLLRFVTACQRCIIKRNPRLVRPFGFQHNGKHL